MPFRKIPGKEVEYALISFDKSGTERTDDPAAIPAIGGRSGKLSDRLINQLASEPVTDVFLFVHGWKDNLPAAIEQYNAWIGAMADASADQQQMEAARANFKPFWIGVHWPSQPWDDEEIAPADADGDVPASGPSLETLQEEYLERLGDTPEIRAALDVIFEDARHNPAAISLPSAVRDAYVDLNFALGLEVKGEGAGPGDDRKAFDPNVAFQAGNESVALGGSRWNFGGILAPLRQLSFWKMMQRANSMGEGSLHQILSGMMSVTSARGTRFHLAGHSFGCIAASSMLGGRDGRTSLPGLVSSVVLLQGPFSMWSYSPDIPRRPGRSGYFAQNLTKGRITGPLIATQSRFDNVVGRFYPTGAGLAGQAAYDLKEDGLPTIGAAGTFGIRGIPEGESIQTAMLAASGVYSLAPGKVYNLDADEYIRRGEGASGAHCDICGPEVAHAIWQAAIAGAASS